MTETETPKTEEAPEILPGDQDLNRIENVMSQFLAAADVQAVFGEPVEQGEFLVIPAAEVLSVAGVAMGSGSGNGPDEKTGQTVGGRGSGGGGGGNVQARPVAVIVISPAGVRVEPIIDVTKLAIAFLTALGFMVTMRRRMRRGKIG